MKPQLSNLRTSNLPQNSQFNKLSDLSNKPKNMLAFLGRTNDPQAKLSDIVSNGAQSNTNSLNQSYSVVNMRQDGRANTNNRMYEQSLKAINMMNQTPYKEAYGQSKSYNSSNTNLRSSQNTYVTGSYTKSTENNLISEAFQQQTYSDINGPFHYNYGSKQPYITDDKPRHQKGASTDQFKTLIPERSNKSGINDKGLNCGSVADTYFRSTAAPLNISVSTEYSMKSSNQKMNIPNASQRILISASTAKNSGSPQKFVDQRNFYAYSVTPKVQSFNFTQKTHKDEPIAPKQNQIRSTYCMHQVYDQQFKGTPKSCRICNPHLSQQHTKYSESTYASKISNVKVDINLNIEDLLIHEEKVQDIIEDLTSDPSNSCYELWNCYCCSSVSSKFENFYKEESSKKIIFEHTVLEFISLIVCYDFQKHGIFAKYEKEFTQIFNYVHQNFLLFSDYLLTKISKSCLNNIWVNKLKQLIKSTLKLAPNNKSENIKVILYHNENVKNLLKSILSEHPGSESYIETLLNFLDSPYKVSLIILSDIFRNKVLKFSVSYSQINFI